MYVFSQLNHLIWSFTKLSNYGSYWDELVEIKHVLQPKEEDDDDDNGEKKTMVIVTPCKLRQKMQMCETLLVDI
jgi:hypothetical protein